MRMLRGWSLAFASVLLSAVWTAEVSAQASQYTLSDSEAPSAEGPVGDAIPAFVPQSTSSFGQASLSQTPRAVASSKLNLPSGPVAAGFAPASYNQMAYPPSYSPGVMPIANYGAEGMMGPAQGSPMGPSQGPPMGPPSVELSGDYSGSMYPSEMMEGYPGGMAEGDFCPNCGGAGCDYCGLGHGILADFIHRLLPYAEGGRCAPRWYDIALDGMFLKRESVGQQVNFATFTRLDLGGTVALSTGNLDYQDEPGFRFNAAMQVLPGHNLEFTYFGLFNWASVASATDPTNNLFSVYSNFGQTPINGFDQSDQSPYMSLRSSSTIDNFEINLRKRNTGPNCRVQYSWMWGARYIYLLDDIEFFTLGRSINGVSVGQSDSDVRVRNSLTGFQIGGDAWTTLIPGVAFGTDMKGGVYGNYAKQNTSVVTTLANVNPQPASVQEEATNNDIAFVGEVNFTFIYRTSPNWTMRAGYQFLYLDGVALAADNFNTSNPFGLGRAVRELDDNSDVFYHGGFAGFEWMW